MKCVTLRRASGIAGPERVKVCHVGDQKKKCIFYKNMLFLLAVTRERETIGSHHESSNKISVILVLSGQNIIDIVIRLAVKTCSDYQERYDGHGKYRNKGIRAYVL